MPVFSHEMPLSYWSVNPGPVEITADTCPWTDVDSYLLTLHDGANAPWDENANPPNERVALQDHSGSPDLPYDTPITFAYNFRFTSLPDTLPTSDWGWHTAGVEIHSNNSTGQSPVWLGLNVYTNELEMKTWHPVLQQHQYYSLGFVPELFEWYHARVHFRLTTGTHGVCRVVIDRPEGTLGDVSYYGATDNGQGGYRKIQVYRRAIQDGTVGLEVNDVREYHGADLPDTPFMSSPPPPPPPNQPSLAWGPVTYGPGMIKVVLDVTGDVDHVVYGTAQRGVIDGAMPPGNDISIPMPDEYPYSDFAWAVARDADGNDLFLLGLETALPLFMLDPPDVEPPPTPCEEQLTEALDALEYARNENDLLIADYEELQSKYNSAVVLLNEAYLSVNEVIQDLDELRDQLWHE